MILTNDCDETDGLLVFSLGARVYFDAAELTGIACTSPWVNQVGESGLTHIYTARNFGREERGTMRMIGVSLVRSFLPLRQSIYCTRMALLFSFLLSHLSHPGRFDRFEIRESVCPKSCKTRSRPAASLPSPRSPSALDLRLESSLTPPTHPL